MLKKIAKNIILVYLSCFVFLASVAIPYCAHTCLASESSHVSFLVQEDSCSDVSKNACSESCIEKDACCSSSHGIINIETILIFASIHNFVPDLSFQFITVHLNPFIDLSYKTPSYTAANIPPDVPIRILQQSFLC